MQRHLGPGQPGLRKPQACAADDCCARADVEGLSDRLSDLRQSASATQFRPSGQQCLQKSVERDINADVNGRGQGQNSQGLRAVAAGDQGVGNAKRHDGELADEHGARIDLSNRMDGDVLRGAQVSLSFAPEPAVAS